MKYLLTMVAIASLVSGCVYLDYIVMEDTAHDYSFRNELVSQKQTVAWVSQAAFLPSFYDSVGGTPHAAYNYLVIDQDDEGNQVLFNYSHQNPYPSFVYTGWKYNINRPLNKKKETKSKNLITVGTFSYTTPRFCLIMRPTINPPGASNSEDWLNWDWGTYTNALWNDECEAYTAIKVAVSQFGHSTERGHWSDPADEIPEFITSTMAAENVVANTFEMSPYEKVEILNELTQNGIFKDGFYNYTLSGNEFDIVVSNGVDQWNIDLSGKSIGVRVSEDLTHMLFDRESAVGLVEASNQIADIRDAAGDTYQIFVKWHNIARIFTNDFVKIAPGDKLRLGQSSALLAR